MLIRRKWNRRTFLRAAGIFGASTALLPILPTIGEAAGPPPKRLLLISTGNGSILPFLRPTRGGSLLADGDTLSGATSEILQPILDRHADKMILVDGVDISSWVSADDFGSHGALTSLWNGTRGGGAPSVDQVIADHIGGTTAIHSLQTATFEPQDDSISSYGTDAANTALPNSDSRQATFDALFRGFTPPDPDAMPIVDHAPARRQRSFDVLRGEIGRLRAELPTDDRYRLDEHLCRFDELEQRLAAPAVPVGASCIVPGSPSTAPLQVVPTDAELIAQAFACDRTRVISHQLTIENGIFNRVERILQYVPTFDATFGNDHNTSHMAENSTAAAQAFLPMKQFEADAVAQFLDALASTPEDGGSVLDNTIVVWGTGLSHGGPHDSRMTPWMIFHGSNGPFRTNRLVRKPGANLLDLDSWCDKRTLRANIGNGYPNNRVLASLLDAFEVPGEHDTFGDPRFGGGPLTELY